MDSKPIHIPSASVILLRQGGSLDATTTEVLLLKKNQKISFGGSWVFPGGRIDEQDYSNDLENKLKSAHEKGHDTTQEQNSETNQSQIPKTSSFTTERNTVVRECHEETGLDVDPSKLIPISRWKTPPIRPKRFSTVFFAYDASNLNTPVKIDHGEIVDADWFSINDVLDKHNQKQLELSGPAFVTLSILSTQPSFNCVWRYLESLAFTEFTPKIQVSETGAICLYHGDECYDLIDPDSTSKSQDTLKLINIAKQKHRLLMHKEQAWVYINNELGIEPNSERLKSVFK